MEGLDGERPLQTGEVVIIVVVLLMWAGESWMGNRGLGSVTVGSGEGCLSFRRKGREREWGEGRRWEVIRTGSQGQGCTGTRD